MAIYFAKLKDRKFMNLKKPRKKIYQILDSASHMKSVLNAVNEGVITFDSDLRIIMINRFALNLWGYSREQILGKNLSILIDKPYSGRIKRYAKEKKLSEKINLLRYSSINSTAAQTL